MKIRETAIAKLQQLPEPLLQQVSDFIDLLTDRQQHTTAIDTPQGELAEVWAQWFEAVDRLEVIPTEPVSDYQQLLLTKYRRYCRVKR
jgi:hypothetical protein